MTITEKITTINRLLAEVLQELSGPRGCGRPGEPPYTPEPAIPVLKPLTCKVARLSAPEFVDMPAADADGVGSPWWCCKAEFGEHEPTCKNFAAKCESDIRKIRESLRPTLKRTPPELPDFGAADSVEREALEARRLMDAE
jgi:hypothetical protein